MVRNNTESLGVNFTVDLRPAGKFCVFPDAIFRGKNMQLTGFKRLNSESEWSPRTNLVQNEKNEHKIPFCNHLSSNFLAILNSSFAVAIRVVNTKPKVRKNVKNRLSVCECVVVWFNRSGPVLAPSDFAPWPDRPT